MITHEEQAATLERSDSMRDDRVSLQTFRRSYAQILAGADPWIPLGNFMHQFFGTRKDRRSELLRDPIDLPAHPTPEQRQWAVFCVASVEYLAQKYDLVCPNWVKNPTYVLAEPWYYDINADLPEVQEELRQTTPEAFSRRNVFCGDRTYQNKYEHKGRQGRRTA